MPKIWRYTNRTSQRLAPHREALAIQRWKLDFIGEIHPASSKGHRFVLVATDYFTKWTEAVPLKNMRHKVVINFMLGHIVHRFGIPNTQPIKGRHSCHTKSRSLQGLWRSS
jgi:hypothetical protein